MFERLPPREIQDIINFPINPEYQFENVKFYNRIMEKAEIKKEKYERNNPKPINYQIGEKILILVIEYKLNNYKIRNITYKTVSGSG